MPLNPRWDTVQKLIEAFLELYPEAEYEFAHVVLSDYNLTDEDIQSALKRFNEVFPKSGSNRELSVRLEATEFFLKFLDCIPEEWRMPGQED